ncbi:Hermansky-Pudlak syndrome 4 protein [Mycetomoellerius zeteki]|uniref:Hermansky-Pudlak syndrome 4 protein n=1 Tax=Mycetomoellerius zeteki TaxID=64791 RepID=UPI00084E6E1F|nr:PREDICTED: Hermansky-Pudlak syndrome 4 protein [Trachymyrmex zeteki]
MAKEMMIVFVYDTAKCCKEEDDPAEAVMYFHPAWVSLTQRLALAGQLMGVHHFLTTSFSAPRSITLQGGKFVLKKFGQYVLAVGTDRNIHDWILERRANTLESLLKFFHCDLVQILESLNNDRTRFTEKLYQMFETYLPILQHSANLFSNIPVIKLPKSASNIFLEGMQVLQHCQEINGILGGALFYNNKIVSTQLGADLTKQIVITDPYRIKAPAERILTEFHLPIGVQLLQVYIERKQFAKLMQEANNERYYNSCLDTVTKKILQRKTVSKTGVKEPSGMKRDTSKIFTVPEEGELDSMNYSAPQYVSSVPLAINHESPIRRKQEIKSERPKGGIVHPLTPSVCATPLKDVDRVLHGNAMLICSSESGGENEGLRNSSKSDDDDIPDVVKEALRCKRLNKLKNATSKKKLMKRKDPDRKSVSLPDLTSSIKPRLNGVPRAHQPELDKILCKLNEASPEDYDSNSPRRKLTRSNMRHSRTIVDPCYPVFRYDGLPVSRSLYEQYIASHCEELRDNGDGIHERHDDDDNLQSRNLPSDLTSAKLPISSSRNSITRDAREECAKPGYDKSKQETYKRSMSLPLKPLNVVAEVSNGDDRRKSTSECGGVGSSFEFPQRRKLDGLQLTPLMSKLSLLADERTSGFCSRETTPSEFRDLSGFSGGVAVTTTTTTNQLIRQKLESVEKEASDGEDELDEDWVNKDEPTTCLVKTELFLCGYQNMVLVLLMENGTANNPDLIHALWHTCVSTLGKLETRLQQCLEPLPSTENKELYSILSVDPQWDTVQRSGLWGVTELDIVSCLHDRFTQASSLTDIIVRTEDTVVYGNQSGGVEVFYQQAVAPSAFAALPTPADLMGIVALKAKRRLERDHGIVLL